MRNKQPDEFRRQLRVPPELFDEILERIGPDITGPGTNYRQSLEPGFKLCVVLKYLAHGAEQTELWTDYVVSRSSICNMIVPVCSAIQRHYAEEVFKTPTTEAEWLAIAQDFEDRWQLPHALGALDGKHCRIKCPRNSGSHYWCVYKKVFSVVLLALVDARYRFIWADLGGVGHQSDAQIYNHSSLKQHLAAGTLNVPPPARLPKDTPTPAPYRLPPVGQEEPDEPEMIQPPDVPYFIIGDDAFALNTYLMKPSSKSNMTRKEHVYSYRISRARRCVENAFGILAHRWRICYKEMQVQPEKAICIIKTCIVLHNLLRYRYPGESAHAADVENANGTYIQGQWRATVGREDENDQEPAGVGFKHATKDAKAMQSYLMDYFYDQNRGGVPWQENRLFFNRQHPGRVPGLRVQP